jgi:hypothetical protein
VLRLPGQSRALPAASGCVCLFCARAVCTSRPGVDNVASSDSEPGPSNQDVLDAIQASQQQLSTEIQEGFAQ